MCELWNIITYVTGFKKGDAPMTIGEKIKALRKRQNISVDELASKLGKNRATIYRYERGDIENLPLDTLDPLAKALHTTPAYLMGWEDKREEPSKEIYNYFEEVGFERYELWFKYFGHLAFTDEEYNQLIEFARFIIYLREH